ncbi:MAG: histidinol dehydrogenase [Methylocapsa sp.]|nr:histidinol dehydrogenase [Methylocapsa sp.]
MPLRLTTQDPDFPASFDGLLKMKREAAEDVDLAVAEIIAEVIARGDAALYAYSRKFDWADIEKQGLRVPEREIGEASQRSPKDALAALEFAYSRILAFHERQVPQDLRYKDPCGIEVGWRWLPIESAGIYVPGGTASYPSSVLMNAAPAKVAGVSRLVMAVPAPNGQINPLVLAAAKLAGIDEIYRIGGAQAIAALAFGTQSIAPVAKIAGPGNAYVAAAKRRVFGAVGIDMIAGPSEVLILADGSAKPEWVAADLLAQAEHDAAAQAVLITNDEGLADAVEEEAGRQLKTLPRSAAAASWHDFGAIILAGSLEEGIALANRIAPEHLEIIASNAEALARNIRNAGAIFIGPFTPEAIGDYVGGTNHVLPTARSARFSSGLSVLDFMKRTSILKCGADGLAALGEAAIALGRAEGLEGHARSVALRLNSRAI